MEDELLGGGVLCSIHDQPHGQEPRGMALRGKAGHTAHQRRPRQLVESWGCWEGEKLVPGNDQDRERERERSNKKSQYGETW